MGSPPMMETIGIVYIAHFTQSLAERRHKRVLRREAAEIADHRHRRLLGAGGERPRSRAAQDCDQIPPVQSFTSSLGRACEGNYPANVRTTSARGK